MGKTNVQCCCEGVLAAEAGLGWITNPYTGVFFNTNANRARMYWWHIGWESYNEGERDE